MLIPMYFKNCTDLNNKREKGLGKKRKEKRPPEKNIYKIKKLKILEKIMTVLIYILFHHSDLWNLESVMHGQN